jgi:hypothetical protein
MLDEELLLKHNFGDSEMRDRNQSNFPPILLPELGPVDQWLSCDNTADKCLEAMEAVVVRGR